MQELLQAIANDPKLLYGLPSSVVTVLLIINRIYFAYSHYKKSLEDMDFAIKLLENTQALTGKENWLFEYYRVVPAVDSIQELITRIRTSRITVKTNPIIYGLKLAFSNPFADEIDLGGFPYSFKFFKLSR